MVSKWNLITESAAADAVVEAFFAQLQPDRIASAWEEALRYDRRRRDFVYRVFHGSFKVYHMGEYALDALRTMLEPLGVENIDDAALISALRRWTLDGELIAFADELRVLQGRAQSNATSASHEDTRGLSSGYLVVMEVAHASLEAMARMVRREGFLWNAGPFDPTDALFLEAWTSLGEVLRYRCEDRDYARWRAMLEPKLQRL